MSGRKFFIKHRRKDTLPPQAPGSGPTASISEMGTSSPYQTAFSTSGSARRNRGGAVSLSADDGEQEVGGKADPFLPVENQLAKLKSLLYYTYYPNAKSLKKEKKTKTKQVTLLLTSDSAGGSSLNTPNASFAGLPSSSPRAADKSEAELSDDEEYLRNELFDDLLERVVQSEAFAGGATPQAIPAGGLGNKKSSPASPLGSPKQAGLPSPMSTQSLGITPTHRGGSRKGGRSNLAQQQEIQASIQRHRDRLRQRELRFVADTASIEYRTVKSMLSPILRLLTDLNKRCSTLHKEKTDSKQIEKIKNEIYGLADQLGLDPQPYVVTEESLDFKETRDYLLMQKDTLTKLVVDREAQLNEKIEEINKMREALDEAPIPLLNSLDPQMNVNNSSSGVFDLDKSDTSMGGGLSPAHPPLNLDSPPKKDRGGQDPKIGLGGASVDDSSAAVHGATDLSSGALKYYDKLLEDTSSKKDNRSDVVKQLAVDIIGLWKEDGQIPTLQDPEILSIDKKILLLLKNNFINVQGIIGVDQDAIEGLADRKRELVVAREDRIRTTMEMSKRLKLIEDRQYLLELMKQFEAQAQNPLRLFGTSTRLVQEEKFRNSAYPRLLLIEAVIRPSLLLYEERHGRPFFYQGANYLEVLDQELKSRVVPRDIFPSLKLKAKPTLSSDLVEKAYTRGVAESAKREKAQEEANEQNRYPTTGEASADKSALELLFGSELHDDCMKGLEESLAKVVEDKVADFARVVQLSTSIGDVLAERVVNMSNSHMVSENLAAGNSLGTNNDAAHAKQMKAHDISDEEWCNRSMKSFREKEVEQQKARLQELGWRLPAEFGSRGNEGTKERVDSMLERHKVRSSSARHSSSQRRKSGQKSSPERTGSMLAVTKSSLVTPSPARNNDSTPNPRLDHLARHKGYHARVGPVPAPPDEPEPPKFSVLKNPCRTRHNNGQTCDESLAQASIIGSDLSASLMSTKRTGTQNGQLVRRIDDRYGIHDKNAESSKTLGQRQEEENAKAMILRRHMKMGSLPTSSFTSPDEPLILSKSFLIPSGTKRLLAEGSTPSKSGSITITSHQLANIQRTSHAIRADQTDSARKLAKERNWAYRSHHNDEKVDTTVYRKD